MLSPALAAQLLIPVAGTAVHVAAIKVKLAVYDGAVVTRAGEGVLPIKRELVSGTSALCRILVIRARCLNHQIHSCLLRSLPF